jgi:hypothetical protein
MLTIVFIMQYFECVLGIMNSFMVSCEGPFSGYISETKSADKIFRGFSSPFRRGRENPYSNYPMENNPCQRNVRF